MRETPGDLDKALADIVAIRMQIARDTAFRGLGAATLAATGVLAGLLGVGGGIVIVPVLTIAFGVPLVLAKGTSLLVIIPTAVVGTIRNRSAGLTALRPGLVGGGAGVVSAAAMQTRYSAPAFHCSSSQKDCRQSSSTSSSLDRRTQQAKSPIKIGTFIRTMFEI